MARNVQRIAIKHYSTLCVVVPTCTLLLAGTLHVAAIDNTCRLTPGPSGTITEILDPTTVILDDKIEIRLTAVLPPRGFSPKDNNSGDRTPLASKAKSALGDLVLDKAVELAYDGRRRDRYGRTLAHLYVRRRGERIWVQRFLVEGGCTRVASYRDNRACIRLLQDQERTARQDRRGLWAHSRYQILPVRNVANILGRIRTFQLVEGTVLKVGEAKGWIFLNFGENWKNDFTVSVARRNQKLFRKAHFDLKALAGKRIRVRGWIERWNGPMIKVTHPEQIEILDPIKPPAAPPQKKDPGPPDPGLPRI